MSGIDFVSEARPVRSVTYAYDAAATASPSRAKPLIVFQGLRIAFSQDQRRGNGSNPLAAFAEGMSVPPFDSHYDTGA